MKNKFLFVTSLGFITALMGCSDNKVQDDWSGIDEMTIENETLPNGRALSADSFRLNSKLLLPKIAKDDSYSVTTNCRINLDNPNYAPTSSEEDEGQEETSKPSSFAIENGKAVTTKKVEYKPEDDKYLKPLPIINHLPDLVHIYPERLESCDFRLNVQTPIESSDSSSIEGAKFHYLAVDHELGIDTKRINLNELAAVNLYESNSKLLIEYLNPPEALKDENSESNTKPGQRSGIAASIQEEEEQQEPLTNITDAKIFCYTNEEKTTEFELNSDGNSFSMRSPKETFHAATPNYPAENCVFMAKNRDNVTLTSPTFSIIHNLSRFEEETEALLNPVYKNSRYPGQHPRYSQRAEISDVTLMEIEFDNTSDEVKLIQINKPSIYTNSTLFKITKTSFHDSNKVADVLTITNNIHTEPIQAELKWNSQFLNTETGLLTLPPKERTNIKLTLHTDRNIKNELGLLAAPNKDLDIFKISTFSRNVFKDTPIENGSIESFFNLGNDMTNFNYKGEESQSIIQESLFAYIFENTNNTQETPLNLFEQEQLRQRGDGVEDSIIQRLEP